jgi:hypothetical protein
MQTAALTRNPQNPPAAGKECAPTIPKEKLAANAAKGDLKPDRCLWSDRGSGKGHFLPGGQNLDVAQMRSKMEPGFPEDSRFGFHDAAASFTGILWDSSNRLMRELLGGMSPRVYIAISLMFQRRVAA